MSDSMKQPHTIVEVEPNGAVRAWEPIYNFDTTAGGTLDPLPVFHFDLRQESSGAKRKNERPFRLYLDGSPCIGWQWQYDVEGALMAVEHVVASYAFRRRSAIYAAERAAHFASLREKAEDTE